jgi:L-lactate dehydrogenase complex protein LldG
MTDTRTRILERVRRALNDVPADETPKDVPVPRAYRRARRAVDATDAREAVSIVVLFAERAADYRAHVQRATEADAGATIARLLAESGIDTLVVPRGLPEHYLAALDRVEPGTPTLLRDESPLPIAALDASHGVVSVCALAIAETGTIVLDGGAGQGRRALTLLPDYHLCLVRAEQIVASVPDAFARLDPRCPMTMISGPSATSDIENSRVEGVHGPRTLHILIIDPA